MRSILFVLASLSAGGAERIVSEMANYWGQKGWTVGLLTLSDSRSDHYILHKNVRRICLDAMSRSETAYESLVNSVRRIVALRRAIRSFAPDVVLSMVDRTNVLVLAAMPGLRIPAIVSERIDPTQYDIGRIGRAARRVLYPLASAVVVQTATVAGWARAFLPANKVRVIPNFVCARISQPKMRERLILAVGRLEQQKGFDILLVAYAKSKAVAHGYRLVILGAGSQREALLALADQLGIAEYLEMPGVVAAPEEWMERAAIFVLSSRYEGFPNALVEAMAMGCAVIATDCPSGPREIVRTNEDGLLVRSGDADSMAHALSTLIENEGFRERLGSNAMAIRKRLAPAIVLSQWESLIEELVAR